MRSTIALNFKDLLQSTLGREIKPVADLGKNTFQSLQEVVPSVESLFAVHCFMRSNRNVSCSLIEGNAGGYKSKFMFDRLENRVLKLTLQPCCQGLEQAS